MAPLTRKQDAFGREMMDVLLGRHREPGVIERDDGQSDTHVAANYFAEYPAWADVERRALRRAKGRVLDVGSGAGRVSLYLQAKGHDVVALDNSPLALKVCRKRGVKRTVCRRVTQITRALGPFDTVVMFGNNLGLLENPTRARYILRRLHAATAEGAIILGEGRDPATDNPEHLSYHRRNRAAGRMRGQARIRVRYADTVSPWFDWLLLSPDELRGLIEGTGWAMDEVIARPGEMLYVAVLARL